MKKSKDFSIGVSALFKGFKLFLTKPCYWRYALWPLLLSMILYAIGFYLYFAYLQPFLMELLPETAEYPQWNDWIIYSLRWLFNISAVLFGIMITLLTVTILYSTLAAPFFDRMTLSMEKDCFAFEPPDLGCQKSVFYFANSILNVLILNLQTLFWAILLFPVSLFIPYIGTLIYSLVVGYFFGLSLLLYSAEHRAMSRADFKQSLNGNRMKVLGFGTAAYFLLYIPLLAILLLPIALAGGVILFNKEIEKQ
ncbi:MAG: EI24 domain-containing protein [Victivallales bacterium]|nr:EI24 domain-containing protein [Victivallales bacterium]